MVEPGPYRMVRDLSLSEFSHYEEIHTPEKPEWKEKLRDLERTYKGIAPVDVLGGVLRSHIENGYILSGG